MSYSVSSMTTTLRRVALRQPAPALLQADPAVWHYGPTFDPARVSGEHEAFARLLDAAGVEIVWLDGDDWGIADAVFTYDASLVTPAGAILMNPGKKLRQGEQLLHRQLYQQQGIPIIGAITYPGNAEAGDTLWLDDHEIAIGRGFRTNAAGVAQLEMIFQDIGIRSHVFDLPVYQGKAACLHLMSLISLVDTKTALVCKPLLPVALWQLLTEKEFTLLEAPYEEFVSSGTLSTNVLAVAPGHCIMIAGLPQTRAVLERAGIEVQLFQGDSLCIGCEGGPTCLTRPLLRR